MKPFSQWFVRNLLPLLIVWAAVAGFQACRLRGEIDAVYYHQLSQLLPHVAPSTKARVRAALDSQGRLSKWAFAGVMPDVVHEANTGFSWEVNAPYDLRAERENVDQLVANH